MRDPASKPKEVETTKPETTEFSLKDNGEFQFGYVRGQMECRVTVKGGNPGIEFTWEGFDELDSVSGYGWAAFESDSLAFDDGDVSGFTAERAAQKSARKRK